MALSAGKYWGLRRLADGGGRFKMIAVDQRPPIKNLVRERRGTEEAAYADVAAVKVALVRELGGHASALLLDPHVAFPQAIHLADPRRGLVLTLEDSRFEEGPGGRRSAEIDHWSVGKIKRAGGDAVKVLAWYRPDASAEVCAHQQAFVRRVGAACRRYDLPFVFELLVYPMPGETGRTTDYVEHGAKRPELVIDSVAEFAKPDYGVDLFKLESPIAAPLVPDPDSGEAAATQDLFNRLGAAAGRPWVMLSAGAGQADFKRVLHFAYRAGASGYLAGRAIWWSAFQAFPDLEAMTARLRGEAVPYMADLNILTDRSARPWTEHEALTAELAGKGPGFRVGYGEMEDPS